ncbi:MAG: hypothetical protein LBM67_05045, partial [Lentimicrobiaceae bacterium]|nr:hypothetical protein [Lentimicrobiaceae bacterium]
GDVEIQKEVDTILRDKEQSLTFKDKDGKWNVRRFFFSKWTLCEGWDNPNVFVITKLRSSGSEIRKLQEVGRGLRLPFDENGVRISDEEFYLTYIIDYSEHSFAKKLVGEINADGGTLESGKITDEILNLLVKAEYAPNANAAFFKLGGEGIIDANKNILDTEKLFALLPESSNLKLKAGKIIGEDLPEKPQVRLNKENFEKLRDLWNEVTKRYLLHFEAIKDNELHSILVRVFSDDSVFIAPTVQIVEEQLTTNDSEHIGLVSSGYKSANSMLSVIPYGEFLKRISRQTDLPVSLLHASIVEARKGKDTSNELFNMISLDNTIKKFNEEFVAWFAQKFSYTPLDYTARTTLFTVEGNFVDTLAQGIVGEIEAKDILRDKENYLYDKYVYDTEIEHQVLKVNPPTEVIAYGKLPRRSIKLPTYTGGTTSPDFVYAIRNARTDATTLHLIVETKSDNPRLSDKIAVDAQQKAFENIANIEWRMETDVREFEKELRRMTDKL